MTRPWLLASLCYLAMGAFQLYPAWTSPLHGVVGDWTHPDMVSNHWLYRWVAGSLLSGTSILHNDRYYFPIGDAPWLAGNGSDAVPFTLLGALIPWPASVTVWSLLTITLNGLSGYALARAAGAGTSGALVGGAALVFCPFVPRELSAGRFAQASLWACGFFLASWLRLLARPTIAGGIGAGALFGLAAFTYWYNGLWMALAGAILWCAQPSRRSLLTFIPAAILFTGPPLAVFLSHWEEIPGIGEGEFPHPLTVTYALTPSFPVWSGTGAMASLALPLTVSALAVFGFMRAPRSLRWGCSIAAVCFYALCLGPEILAPDGTSTGLPGPYSLLYRWTDTLRRFWWPYRHLAPLTLVLVPLLAHGAHRLTDWLALRGAPFVVTLLLPLELSARSAVLTAESSHFTAPAAYTALASLPPGNVLELPIASALSRTQSSLSYQWVHGNTLVNGHAMWVDRVRPDQWDAWLAKQPLLDALRRFEEGDLSGAWSLEGRDAFAADSLRYITLNREFFPGELRTLQTHHATFLTAWFGAPVVKDGGVRIWDVTRATADTYTFPTYEAPNDYVSADGLTALPESVRAAGWKHWPRAFPPSAPSEDTENAKQKLQYADLPPMLRRKLERQATVDTGE